MRLIPTIFITGVLPGLCAAQTPAPLPETQDNPIGFASPAAALTALRARPDVTFKNTGGWLIATDAKNQAIWSFSPVSHPSFPSVVKRYVVQRNGRYFIVMGVLCGSTKAICDQLVRDFQRLNESGAL